MEGVLVEPPRIDDATIAVLRMAPHERSDSSVDLLFSYMTSLKNTLLLKQLTPDALRHLCRTDLRFEAWQPNAIVFYQGADSDSCFLMLRGTVSIWIAKALSQKAAAPEGMAADALDDDDEEADVTMSRLKEIERAQTGAGRAASCRVPVHSPWLGVVSSGVAVVISGVWCCVHSFRGRPRIPFRWADTSWFAAHIPGTLSVPWGSSS